MRMNFADTPKGWYQERVCDILASLSLMIEAHNRIKIGGGAFYWVYYHTMEYHFERAVFDTLRLLQTLTHDTEIANQSNLKDIFENGHKAFINIIEENKDGFDLGTAP